MTYHDSDLTHRLNDFLARRQPPKAFAGSEKAQADQFMAYLNILRRRAPQTDDLHDWWGRFIEALSEASETWAWPSEKEMWNACKVASGKVRQSSEGSWQPDSAKINLGRLERGEPMGEDWLWGRGALQLVAAGADRGALRDRRVRMAQHMAEVWGPDAARVKLLELKAKHEAAEAALDDYRRHPQEMPPVEVKRAFTETELRGLVA